MFNYSQINFHGLVVNFLILSDISLWIEIELACQNKGYLEWRLWIVSDKAFQSDIIETDFSTHGCVQYIFLILIKTLFSNNLLKK